MVGSDQSADKGWPHAGIVNDIDTIMGIGKGTQPPSREQMRRVKVLPAVIVGKLGLQSVPEPKVGELVEAVLGAVINRYSQTPAVAAAGELLGFSKLDDAAISAALERWQPKWLSQTEIEKGRESKLFRLYLAASAAGEKLVARSLRTRQHETWAPAAADALYDYLDKHIAESQQIAAGLGLKFSDIPLPEIKETANHEPSGDLPQLRESAADASPPPSAASSSISSADLPAREASTIEVPLHEEPTESLASGRISGEPATLVDKVASRLFVELRALRRLLGRAGRRIRRNVRRFMIICLCILVGSVVSGGLTGQVQPLWFGPLRGIAALLYFHAIIVLFVVGLPVLVACVEIGFATRVRAWMVWLIVVPVVAYAGLLGSIFIVKGNETNFYDSLMNEVQHWDQRQYLTFENDKFPEGVANDPCNGLPGSTLTTVTNKVVQLRLSRMRVDGRDFPGYSELDGTACSHTTGILTLRTFDGTNALAGDYGRDYGGQIYASVLLQPDGLAAWTDCGIAVVPAADSSVESVPNFGFEFDSSTSTYRPIVSLSTLHGEPIVARSTTTIPYNDGGSFADSPAGGWLKVAVLRQGNQYTFFVNDRVVLVYDWSGGEPKVHVSIQAHLRGNEHEPYSASCDFAEFGYWTTPAN